MEKFTRLTTVAAPLPQENIDTDQIIPARFLKTIQRTGLGKHLFADQRYDEQGNEKPDFVLNKPAYRKAGILITLDNLGCGSSREHAPWALQDFGIRCVIAPSIADIFHSNCFKNGLLPIRLPLDICETLMDDARQGENARLTVDLEKQQIIRPDGETIPFDVDPFWRHNLLEGLDNISQTLLREGEIEQFEQRANRAWIPSTEGENS
ncbi:MULTISPECIES: 3-isopropylmalate dehydratase small subunit [unclassified Saccharibacter]|uniref:3-isopropylmalate dehydratase small subunit n=1 Tax=unclassified Saccharibacter TaxID=2648722 RepID=UPI001321AD08|nr:MULTISPECIES: 3-isopropylmalate dehydratase small subunit [unclassified Saccharibacter]MXV35533.1 3-isopropylmalate dehydratase small subunit [Saccharibacter sp. EH611]MXV58193.1 3-isopropylmalate dehydratase small subunit [Saccharibacter sp. EH70]MXV65466.1 3-isopropylmalate dehydratase small subunit [Saccharibacter sp. EH60]